MRERNPLPSQIAVCDGTGSLSAGTRAEFLVLAFDSQCNLQKIHLKCRLHISFNCNLLKHGILKEWIFKNICDLPGILTKLQVRIIKDHHIWKVGFLYQELKVAK